MFNTAKDGILIEIITNEKKVIKRNKKKKESQKET